MSQKNHEITDGRLVQTDKKYSHLKLRQKEKIADQRDKIEKSKQKQKFYDEKINELLEKIHEKDILYKE